MKKLRKISRKYYLRQIVACWMIYSLLFFIPVRVAMAHPNPDASALPSVVNSRSGIDAPIYTTGRMDMTQTANEAIVNWQNFDIGKDATVEFHQPGIDAAVLNRVHDRDVTGIMGTLQANGRVFIINPAGIVFGSTACINVSQLVASSLDIADNDFLDGLPYTFTENPYFVKIGDGIVTNEAAITNPEIKRLYLIGRQVINRGALVANECVIMAAGQNVIISENSTSPVAVQVPTDGSWSSGSGLYEVRNEDGEIKAEGETAQVFLAAGDIWSAALIKASSTGGSDAVATVDISAAGNVCITADVVAEAVGSGDDAIAGVTISAGGDIEVRPDSHCDAAVRAIAQDGVNNTADILIEADGDIKVKAEDGSKAEIEAIAKHGMNNLAIVDVEAGGDVKVIAEGWGSGPVSEAEIMALAKDSVTNTANIEVVAGGDVKVIGIDGGQAQIEAIAKEAEISNTANIDITTEDGDVKVLGIGGAYTEGFTPSEALIGATSEYAGNEGVLPGSSNSANITIVANDVVVTEEVIIESSEEDKDGDVLVLGVDGGKAEIEAKAMYGSDNSAGVDITADGDVKVKAEGYESEYEYDSIVSEAEIMALAKEGITNTADIGIVAGGDVVVLSKDGGKAQIEAIAKDAILSNTANIDITAEDGYVLVHGIGGYYYYDEYQNSSFTPSEALIGATAEYAGEEGGSDGSNSANITIVAKDIIDVVEDEISIEIKSIEDGDKDGDVMVIGVNGGKAEIEAKAMYGFDNSAGVDITADCDVKVKAEGYESEYEYDSTVSEAEIMALAKYGVTNTADIGIVAGGDVVVLSKDGSQAQMEAIAKYADNTNTANIDITAEDGYVLVHCIGGYYYYDQYENSYFIPSEALIGATAEYAGEDGSDDSVNSANITIVAKDIVEEVSEDTIIKSSEEDGEKDGDVMVIGVDGGSANIKAEALNGKDNSAGVDITADGDVKVIAIGDEYDSYGYYASEAEIDAHAINQGSYYHFIDPESLTIDGYKNTAGVEITAANVEVKGEDNGGAIIEALAANIIESDGDVIGVFSVENGDSEEPPIITVKDIKNTATVDITAVGDDGEDGDVLVIGECCGEAGIDAEAWNEVSTGYFGDLKTVSIESTSSNVTVEGPVENKAAVSIDAADDVKVIGTYGGYAYIDAEAWNEVSSGDSIGSMIALDVPSSLYFTVDGSVTNNADVAIAAADDVKVIGEGGGGAAINAETRNYAYYDDLSGGVDNTSNIAINTGGDVLVLGDDGEASIRALAEASSNNTATILINAVGGDVKVIDIGEIYNSATIEARAMDALVSNTADVTINATATTSEYECDRDGEDGEVYLKVKGGDVLVIAKEGGDAAITAFAGYAEPLMDNLLLDVAIPVVVVDETSNTANVTIHATAAEGTRPELVKEAVYEDNILIEPAVYEAVPYTDGGDVKVIAEYGGEAEIEAIAMEGQTNTADVLICIDGGVKVKGESGGEAEIEALAMYGYSNTANVGIGAKGKDKDDGVEVRAENGGEAFIGTKAKYGYTNTAKTIICTQGGVQVVDQGEIPRTAGILAEAMDGTITNAYVGICAVDDVIVNASGYYGDRLQSNGYDSMGGHAMIKAEAGAGRMVSSVSLDVQQQPIPVPDDQELSTANAQVVVVSHKGNVEVTADNGGTAEILAEAHGAHTNTANVGVAAGADLSPADVALPEEPIGDELTLVSDGFDPLPLSGNVLVEARGEGSKAQILAWAHDATSIFEYPEVSGDTQEVTTQEPTIIPGENTAKTVICAPGEVRVTADEGSDAKIKSWAGGWGEEGSINTATTQVYASEVKVDVPDRRGNGISAWAVGSELINVPDNYYNEEFDDGRLTYCLADDGTVAITDGTSTLIVDTYSNRKDCPTCPPCPCEKAVPPEEVVVVPPPPAEEIKEEVFAPVAPLPQVSIPRIEGCPGLMLATASELGIAGETLQVAMGNALALNPSIQPCGASATLLNSAKILRDEDGSRMAAINQVFNSLAPANAPMTPEMEASIAMAFAENGAEGSQYALAKEYIDAFVQYAAVLDVQLGSPVGDSVTFVMDKYGAGIRESSNRNMAAFVISRLESAGTLSK